ncbi:U-scoloptoxin(19)-Tl1a-like isoform X2 [Lycorma delicatula]|uniref:U-scoloptoxin(19)-Tl1a-like isoform X2 n=1 Tax=Lycorma delicatula TaxID=130591 RepID=UPI003F51A499
MYARDKYLIIFFLVCILYTLSGVTVLGAITNKIVTDIESKSPESSGTKNCASSGGICIPANECPEGKSAPLGLCREYHRSGTECCYGLSTTETSCAKLGGECMKWCGEAVRISQATDCASNKICCALVQ